MDVTQRDIQANGMTFTCREAGSGGEPVVLLHGFPETSHMWTRLMPRLAAEGYRCLAPDQRGYSPGARPADVEQYAYAHIADDVVALANAWGATGRFHLVGHDWGGLCGWAVVSRHPERIASWTALSIPHAKAFATAVRDDPEEEPYRGFLQLALQPDIAEATMSANDFALARGVWTESDPAEVDAYIELFRQPGALTAALNYYRASRAHARSLDDPEVAFGPVDVPTTLVWGADDPYIRRRAVDLGAEQMRGPYRLVELKAGHWLTQQQPDAVFAAILDQLRAAPIAQ